MKKINICRFIYKIVALKKEMQIANSFVIDFIYDPKFIFSAKFNVKTYVP